MVKPIVRDTFFLSRRSTPATEADEAVAADLLDTLRANADRCVGMAANMIGISCRVIAFCDNGDYTVLYNPEILKSSQPFPTEEGCLSLDGVRPTRRFHSIKVRYQNAAWQWRIKTYTGWTAQIIQHELDHLDGIII